MLLAASLWARLDGARLPARLEWDGHYWRVLEAGLPLAAGDEIVDIEGQAASFATLLGDPVKLRSRAELEQWLEEKRFLYGRMRSGWLRLEVLRQGQLVPLRLSPARDSWREWAREAWIEVLPACFFLWAGWTTLARAPRRPESFWFCLMCLLTSLCYLASTPFRTGVMLHPTALTCFLAINLASFLFGPAVLLHVTLLVPERSVRTGSLVALYALVGLTLMSLDVPLQVGVVGSLYAAVLLAVVWATWRYRSSVHRQQMKWIWAGYVWGLTPGLLFNGLPLLLGRERVFEDAVVGFFLICIPWFYSLAIQRYRLFDIETLAEGSLVYVFTLALICLLEMSLLAALGGGFALPTATVILMALIASSYGAVHVRVARLFPRKEPEVVQEFLARASGRPSAEVLDCLYQTLQEWPAPQSLQWIAGQARVGCDLYLGEPVTAELQLEAPRGLLLGPLQHGHYTSRVVLLLEQLARQAALLYQNARLFEEEAVRRESALEERERLLNDLHDGVGATLASIRMLSGQPEVSALAGDALFELQHFLYDGLDYTLAADVLVAEFRAYGNRILPDFVLTARVEVEVVNRSAGLAAFRVYRETLQRCRAAERLRLHLEILRERMVLVVEAGEGLSERVELPCQAASRRT
ncbi:MAG: hypothetical protein KF760_30160 [Candidatus Eremiobacteraeota bacterium]|nr:hypothetical protein [Candidatus Eremiobacteraeota bacterium]